MAKPGSAPTQWASDATFTGGPKTGQPTKDGLAGLASQGLVPGDTIKAEAANEMINELCLWADWVYDGTSLNTTSAHIVETTAAGTVEVRGIVLAPDTDTFAACIIDGTNLSTSWAVEATDITLGFTITAAATANATLMLLDTGVGGVASFALDIEAPVGRALRVRAVGNATASAIASIERDSGSGAALLVENSGSSGPVLIVSNDNDGAAAIDIQGQPSDDRGDVHLLDSRATDPAAADEGDVWHIGGEGYPLRFQADPGFYPSSPARRVLHAPQDPVWQIDGQNTSIVTATATASIGTTILTSTSAILTDDRSITIIWGGSYSVQNAGATITVELVDVTAGPVLLSSISRSPQVNSTNGGDGSWKRVLVVTPPADGARQYRITAYRSAGAGNVYCRDCFIELRQGILGS